MQAGREKRKLAKFKFYDLGIMKNKLSFHFNDVGVFIREYGRKENLAYHTPLLYSILINIAEESKYEA